MDSVHLVIIVYKDRSVLVDSVFSDFHAAEDHAQEKRNEVKLLQNSQVDFIYTSHGYNVR